MGIKWEDSVNLSTTTYIESYCLWVQGKHTAKSILMPSHIHVGTWISYSKPPDFWCSVFTCWKFGHLLTHYVLLQTFLEKYFPKVMVYFCRTRMNGVTGLMGFLKDSVPQHTYIGNTESFLVPEDTIPLMENDSLSLPRTDSFNSINGRLRCCLDFTSTTNDDSELWWTIIPLSENLPTSHPI